MRTRNRGFTLIELMVSMAVLAILLSLAAPAFTSLIASQRVKTAASNLQSFLLTTRSEAVKRNDYVILAPASQSTLAGRWDTTGWSIVYAQNTSSCPSYPIPNNEVLATTSPVSDVTVKAQANCIVFQSNGRVSPAPANPAFTFCSPKTSDVRCLEIELSGLFSITTPATSQNCASSSCP